MKDWTIAKAAILMGIAAIVLSGPAAAGPLGVSLFDPDPQPGNGTISTSALSDRTPAGITPVMNDLTGRGYPDITAYYDSDARLTLPPLLAVPRGGKIYFHRRAAMSPLEGSGYNW